MNWDAIGAVGEVGGAIAVVATLVYLGIQVRHAKSELRGVRLENVMAAYSDFWETVSASGEAAAVFHRGTQRYAELAPEERVQFYGLMSRLLMAYEQSRVFYEEGIFSAEHFQGQEDWLVSILNLPGAAIWWNEIQSEYPAETQRRLGRTVHLKPSHSLAGGPPSASSSS